MKKSYTKIPLCWGLGMAFCLLGSLPPVALGANKYWIGGYSIWWDYSTNWSPYGMPVDGDYAYLTSLAENHNHTVYFYDTYPYASLDRVTIDATGAGSTLTLSHTYVNHNLLADALVIGQDGYGKIRQSIGQVRTHRSLLGRHQGSTGIYELAGGTLTLGDSLNGGEELIGDQGTGTFLQSGGTHRVYGGSAGNPMYGLILGFVAGSTGNYNLTGGTLQTDVTHVGAAGTGTFVHSGGTHQATALDMGTNPFGVGSYELSGTGELIAQDVILGYMGESAGSFQQNGGMHRTGELKVGLWGSGSYELQAGSLTATTETIGKGEGGTGSFTQTGGSHLAETLTIAQESGSAGTFALQGGSLQASTIQVNDNGAFSHTGGILAYDTFRQAGGTINSSLTNGQTSTFIYSGGDFNGRLTNSGTVELAADFAALNGIENNTSLTITPGRMVSANGMGMANNGLLHLEGILNGSGVLDNYGRLEIADGTIDLLNGINNYGTISQQAGAITLINRDYTTNYGNIDLADGYQLRLTGGRLLNAGSIRLNAAIVTGTAGLSNRTGGVLSGRGTITGPFANDGGLLLVEDGATTITGGFQNSGIVQLAGRNANLTGGAITNTGTIEGYGQIGSATTNGGIIEAREGTLVFGNTLRNETGGLLTVAVDDKILAAKGLETNKGTISLTGGTLDTNGTKLTSSGQITGHGIVRAGTLFNEGSVTLTGGLSTVDGEVVNQKGGEWEVAHTPAVFTGHVTNHGLFKNTHTTITFAGGYEEWGKYFSDPARTVVTDLLVGDTGYLVGAVGDEWYISNSFTNHSLQNTLWETVAAGLFFNGAGEQHFSLAGSDLGASVLGYRDNFAWGEFGLQGGTLVINDGNSLEGAALYVGLFELSGGLDQLLSIYSDYNIYYNPTLAGNDWLGGQTYALNGAGFLQPVAPVPVPGSALLLGSGLLGLLGLRRRGDWGRRADPQG